MGKPVKIILSLFAALLLLVVAAAIALPLLFDPNDYRDKISAAVKKQTGREFAVGKIKLAVFPWLRVDLTEVKLGNAEGFADEPMLMVRHAEIGVKLLPLLREKRVVTSAVQLDGVVANLAVNDQGRNNWQDLAKPADPAKAEPEVPITKRLQELDIEGVTLSDVQLNYDDQKTAKKYQLSELQLKTGRLYAGTPFSVDGRFKAAAPAATAAMEFSASVGVNASSGEVTLTKADIKLAATQTGAAPLEFVGALKADTLTYATVAQSLSTGPVMLTVDKLAIGPASKPSLSAKGTLAASLAFDLASGKLSLTQPKVQLDVKQSGATPLATLLTLQSDSLVFDRAAQTLSGAPLTLAIDSLVLGAADKPLLTAKGQLKTKLSANLATQVQTLEALTTELQLSGSALPGSKPQMLKLSANIVADLAQQQVKISQLQLAGLGLKANADQWLIAKLNSAAPALTGDLTVAAFEPRTLLASLGVAAPKTADPSTLKSASLSTQLAATAKSASFNNLTLKLDDTTLRGSAAIRDFASKAISFALKADQLNADRYLPPPVVAASEISTAKPADKAALNAIELPVKMLEDLNAQGTLELATLKVKNLKLANVRLKLDGAADATKRQQLSADLYGGSADVNLSLAAGARHALKLVLNKVNAGTLLQDFLKSDKLSGKASMTLDVTSVGRNIGEVRRALNGTLSFNVLDGAVKGFNLGKIIRDGQALLLAQATTSSEAQATDFAELSGSGVFVNGVLKSDQLNAKNPFIRLQGAGEIDLVKDTINYLAKPTLVNTASGQGGKELAGLSSIVVPIRISGDLYQPKVSIDWQAALKQQAVNQLREKLGVSEETVREKRTELRDKAKDEISKGLFKLLGGKTPAPAPAEPPPPPAGQ